MEIFNIVVFILSCGLFACECGPLDTSKFERLVLKEQLLQNYSTSVPPSNSTTVNVSFTPIAILALDEASQVFTFSGTIILVWEDPSMMWNPFLNQIQSMNFDEKEIWYPTVVIPNGVGDVIEPLSSKIPLSVLPLGVSMMFVMKEFQVICDMDMTWYPYDVQTCKMSLLAFMGIKLEVGETSRADLFTNYFTGSSEWQLLNITKTQKIIDTGDDYPQYCIDVDFKLRRHSIFYTLNIIFPMCLLSFLNSCVFLLPTASGERISFLVSIFVSCAVFLNYINDSVPKSNRASRLTIYLVLLLCQSAIALLATLFVMNIYHGDGSSMCALGRTRVSNQDKSQAWEEDSQKRSRDYIGRIDKIFFVVFLAMAAASLLLFVDI